MEFCKKCGAMMNPVQKKGSDDVEIVCPKCKSRKGADENAYSTTQAQKKDLDIIVVDQQNQALPETKNECRRCHNPIAYWWVMQTRAADEAPTRFYKCKKCGNVWRESS